MVPEASLLVPSRVSLATLGRMPRHIRTLAQCLRFHGRAISMKLAPPTFPRRRVDPPEGCCARARLAPPAPRG